MTCHVTFGQGQYQCAMVLKFVLFGHGKGFGRLKAITSLDAYQIIEFQILQNSFFFCCLIFEEFEKRFLDQKFYCLLPRQAWSKGMFDFQNCALWSTKAFFIQNFPKWKEVLVRMDSPTMITTFLRFLLLKLGNIFIIFCFCFFFALNFYSLFRNISNSEMIKTWNKNPFILCKCLT